MKIGELIPTEANFGVCNVKVVLYNILKVPKILPVQNAYFWVKQLKNINANANFWNPLITSSQFVQGR